MTDRHRQTIRGSFLSSIVMSDHFLNMPIEARCLYFHIGVSAYDKGVVVNAKAIARSTDCGEEALNTLVQNGYLTPLDEGKYEITHWYENNGVGETAKKRITWEYRMWRKAVIERDGECVVCGSAENLVAHHIKPFAEYPELRLDLNNGVTMCSKCHNKLHGLEKKNGEKTDV